MISIDIFYVNVSIIILFQVFRRNCDLRRHTLTHTLTSNVVDMQSTNPLTNLLNKNFDEVSATEASRGDTSAVEQIPNGIQDSFPMDIKIVQAAMRHKLKQKLGSQTIVEPFYKLGNKDLINDETPQRNLDRKRSKVSK